MTEPIQPGQPDRTTASGDDRFARRPGESDAPYAARLRELEAELAARQTAGRPSDTRAPGSGQRPKRRSAVTPPRTAAPSGRAARAPRDRRAERDRRVRAADRRAGLADGRPEATWVERRTQHRDRRLSTRDRRWVSERRHRPGLAQGGGVSPPSAAFVFAALFVLALLALVAVALF
jgi:hypothetical protein